MLVVFRDSSQLNQYTLSFPAPLLQILAIHREAIQIIDGTEEVGVSTILGWILRLERGLNHQGRNDALSSVGGSLRAAT